MASRAGDESGTRTDGPVRKLVRAQSVVAHLAEELRACLGGPLPTELQALIDGVLDPPTKRGRPVQPPGRGARIALALRDLTPITASNAHLKGAELQPCDPRTVERGVRSLQAGSADKGRAALAPLDGAEVGADPIDDAIEGDLASLTDAAQRDALEGLLAVRRFFKEQRHLSLLDTGDERSHSERQAALREQLKAQIEAGLIVVKGNLTSDKNSR